MDFYHSDIDACYVKFLMQPSFLYHIQTDITPVIKGTKGIHLNEATLSKKWRYANVEASSKWMQGHPGTKLNPAEPATHCVGIPGRLLSKENDDTFTVSTKKLNK